MTLPLPDQADRERAERELGCNFAVEAGAGSGKTTIIVRRVCAMVEAGESLEGLAAVTFTRAAAGELRGRMVTALDVMRRAALASGDAVRAARFAAAQLQLDAAYVGTIHGFCARLLRERPVEARLDPDFREIEGAAWSAWTASWLREWRDAREAEGSAALGQLRLLRVSDATLSDAFATMVNESDVQFDAVCPPLPSMAETDTAFEAALRAIDDLLLPHLPAEAPASGRDGLQKTVLRVRAAAARARAATEPSERHLAQLLVLDRLVPEEWSPAVSGVSMVERIARGLGDITAKRWGSGHTKKQLEALQAQVAERCRPAVQLGQVLHAHRHALAMQVLQEAREAFADARRQSGRLGFADLLMRAAALLRTQPEARAALGRRFTRLIVDEFQDTDPVQAELCFLLAAPEDPETDWRRVTLLPGRLFVVGDPKQSIYRFRRADLAVYRQACDRIVATGGAQLRFTANFRSVASIGAFVDAHFRRTFDPARPGASGQQADFAELNTVHPDVPGAGAWLRIHEITGRTVQAVGPDVEDSAAAIAACVGTGADRTTPAEVMVLAPRHADVRHAARALAAAGVPVAVDGLDDADAPELLELLVLVEALLAPMDEARVAAALQGPVAGASLAELFAAREVQARFTLVEAPDALPEGTVRQGLQQLHVWWQLAAVLPADLLLARILDETGLLVWSASGALGASRVGRLLALLDQVRADGRSLALARELLLARHERDVLASRTLAGAAGAVRVMTVHGAKGLEAEVVHVVGPSAPTEVYRAPGVIVRRSADAASVGVVPLRQERALIGAPESWDALLEADVPHVADERDRLRYVAVTRAKHQLRLSVLRKTLKHEVKFLDTFASPFLEELSDPARALAPSVLIAAKPSILNGVAVPAHLLDMTSAFAVTTVTRRTGVDAEEGGGVDLEATLEADVLQAEVAAAPGEAGQALAWGRCVHRGIEGLLRGRTGAGLDLYLDAVVAEEFALLTAAERADKRGQLARAMAAAQRTPEWARLAAAPHAAAELGVMALDVGDDGTPIVEVGVVDAACCDAEGWLVVDWKTTGAAQWEARAPGYQRQADQYAARLTARHPATATASVVRISSVMQTETTT